MKSIRFDVITIFPHIFDSYLNESILKRARTRGLIKVVAHNLRDFASGRHRTVDDSPYGGGAGMVFKVEPIYKAVNFAKRKAPNAKRRKIILFSTRGKRFNAACARRFALCDQLILICGRYEGVDERVAERIADEEISAGDFVLSGGELPAMIVVEAVARHVPGVLGKHESLEEIKGSYPVYTRPEVFYPQSKGDKKYEVRSKKKRVVPLTSYVLRLKSRPRWVVPKVLLSGNHDRIRAWRTAHR